MRRRVLATVLLAVALGVGALFVPTALLVRQQSRSADVLELQRLAAVAARQAPVSSGDAARWRPPAEDPDHQYALYDASGRWIAGQGPRAADAVVAAASRGAVAGSIVGAEIVAAAPAGTAPDGGVVLRIAEPLEESTARAATTMAGLAGLALSAILLAGGAGWVLTRRLLKPVAALERAARRLGHGDFTIDVPTTGLPEFDDLGHVLGRSAHRIGELLHRERAFAADASHQLRTPLAAAIVALETELISPRPDRTTVLRESLDALTRLDRTVTDLLLLARDDHHRQRAIHIGDVLKCARDEWALRYQAADRALLLECPPVPPVHASEVALRHVLDVLIDNALRHGRGTVSLRGGQVAGQVVVTVTDQGPRPAHPEGIFRRRNPESAGSGIGLALARRLAEAEGARLLLAASDPTTFELVFPTLARDDHAPENSDLS